MGVDLTGQYAAWNYFQSVDSPDNATFIKAFQAKYGADRPTSDPMEAAYTSLYLYKAMVEKAKSFCVDAVNAASDGVTFDAPEGTVTVNGENHHIAKTGLIGQINADNQFDIVWTSDGPDRARSVPRGLQLVGPERGLTPRFDPVSIVGGAVRQHGTPADRPTGSGRRSESRRMDALTTPLLTGTATGAILLLAALGLTLTFGQMGVINMANGEFLMVGAYAAYVTQQVISSTGLSIVVALPVAFVVAGLLGLLLEVSVIQWMYKRPLDTLLVTVGVSLVLQQVAKDVFGAQGDPVTAPSWLDGRISVFGYEWPHRQLFTIVLAVGCARRAQRGAEVQLRSVGRSGRRCRTVSWPRRWASRPATSTASRSSSAPAWPASAASPSP